MRLKLNVTDKGTSYEVVGINQNEGDTDYCEIVELYNIETFSKIAEAYRHSNRQYSIYQRLYIVNRKLFKNN